MNKVFPDLDEKEKALYACLALQHRLGYAGFTRLLEVCGTPTAVYAAPSKKLKSIYPKLAPETADSISRGPDTAAWDKILERCYKLKASIVAPGSSGYPEPLLTLNTPPPLLFMQGSWVIGDARAVAIVGTRTPTAYGRKAAAILARDFAHAGVIVVSGLAVGIDAEAHAGALDGEGRTLAVIGCGLDISYPPENQKLKERIVQNGAVLSEFPPGAYPKRDHFPRRNRILSALARATVVVEAGDHSGALITAAHARSQGKSLFAMPGSVFSPTSSGTHKLLKCGAFLAVSAQDVLPVINSPSCRSNRLFDGFGTLRRIRQAHRKQSSARELTAGSAQGPRIAPATQANPMRGIEIPPVENEPVLDLWRGEDICALDRLMERAREKNLWLPERMLAAMMESLLQLEIRGRIRRLPGPAFKRVGTGIRLAMR